MTGAYPHPRKQAAWKEDRALCEAIFYAGRFAIGPELSIQRLRAIAVPADRPLCAEYREDVIEWLKDKLKGNDK